MYWGPASAISDEVDLSQYPAKGMSYQAFGALYGPPSSGTVNVYHTQDSTIISTNDSERLNPLHLLIRATTQQAFHNSGLRANSAQWHPSANHYPRTQINEWFRKSSSLNTGSGVNTPIMLITGPAASGRSVTMRTVADQYERETKLIAGHFFDGVQDKSKRTARAFLATLIYGIYQTSPSLKTHIINAIRENPLIFSLSIVHQFRELVVKPIRKEAIVNSRGRLMVVDGIDLCSAGEKEEIVKLVKLSVATLQNQILFLISSRTDHDLRHAINVQGLLPYTFQLVLDNLTEQSSDIRNFLDIQLADCRVNHPRSKFIPPHWPAASVLDEIVAKCSGQIQLASIAARYVTDSRSNPVERLATFMEYLGCARRDPTAEDYPLKEMDDLFQSILKSLSERNRAEVLNILSYYVIHVASTGETPSVQAVEDILKLGLGGVALRLLDMGCIISEIEHGTDKPLTYLRLEHATLKDFLFNERRSRQLSIDLRTRIPAHITQCLHFLAVLPTVPPQKLNPNMACHVIETVMKFFYANQYLIVDFTSELLGHIKSLSIRYMYHVIKAEEDRGGGGKMLSSFMIYFLPSFFVFLNRLLLAPSTSGVPDSQNYSRLYNRHLEDYFQLLQTELEEYSLDRKLAFRMALVLLPKRATLVPKAIQLCDAETYECITLIHKYMRSAPSHNQHQYNPPFFAAGALYCLAYLRDHAKASKGIHVVPNIEYMATKWHKQLVNAQTNTQKRVPRMWLITINVRNDKNCIPTVYRRHADLLYGQSIHRPVGRSPNKSSNKRRRALHRVNFEQYQLALLHLIQFLPRAGMSKELLLECTTKTITSRTLDFPNLYRKAQEAMVAYVRKWRDYVAVDPET